MCRFIPVKDWAKLGEAEQDKRRGELFAKLVQIAGYMNLYETVLIACGNIDPEDIMDRVLFAGKITNKIEPKLLRLCASRGIGQNREDGTQSRCHMLRPWTFEDACQEALIPHLDKKSSEKRKETLNYLLERIAAILREYLQHTKLTDPDYTLRDILYGELWKLIIYKEPADDPSDIEKKFKQWFLRTEKEYERYAADS